MAQSEEHRAQNSEQKVPLSGEPAPLQRGVRDGYLLHREGKCMGKDVFASSNLRDTWGKNKIRKD
jgi:hypothetical protein